METPAVLIDMPVVERNIERAQALFDGIGVQFRPHIKTHKIPQMARKQMQAGACGITCQKIGEAEVMADAGLSDILITYNILGSEKLDRLVKLADRCRLSVTADNRVVIEGLSAAFASTGCDLPVLVECDTGAGRCGVQSEQEALELARQIVAAPGLAFRGLMTYPPMSEMKAVDQWLGSARALLREEGIECAVISGGGTPNLSRASEVTAATEHRAGTYIYNDRSLVAAGLCTVDDCALTVQSTIVSRPTATRAVIDAGSKSLTSDLIGLTGYGLIREAPAAQITGLSEEHGVIDLSGCDWRPSVGDRISIIPNHVCPVSNLVDEVYFRHSDGTVETVPVAARGCTR